MRAFAACSPLLLLLACTTGSSPSGSARKCRAIEPNGPDLTGTSLRRIPAPGCAAVEGIQLGAVSLTRGVKLRDGTVLRDVSLRADALSSGEHRIEDFTGAELQGVDETGQKVRLTIDSIARGSTPPGAAEPTYLYRLSYRFLDQPNEPAAPVCAGGEAAIAIPGTWDLRAGVAGGGGKRSSAATDVTFGCPRSAVAKCAALLGYLPWVSAAHDSLHQSCVRAVRADYCGNGQSMTRPDESVNFYDSLGVQRDAADWRIEAQWTPQGARCVGTTRLSTAPADPRTRRPEVKVADYLSKVCPELPRSCPTAATATAADAPSLSTEVGPGAGQ